MIKRSIPWLMIILIALQSVGAMADVHSAHQSGMEHLTFEHEHEHEHAQPHSSPDAHPEAASLTDASQYDCHHCCHCHGAHFSFIASYVHSASLYGRSLQHSYHQPLSLTQQVQSLYRPPRA